MAERLRTAFLISGSGTTAEAVITKCQREEIEGIEPVIVISSNPQAEGLIKTQKLGIKTSVVQQRFFTSTDSFGNELLILLHDNRIDLVAQLGWLPKTPINIIQEYDKRIFNQHPGPLDPGRLDFGGQGMYGLRPHLAILLYQQLTGISLPTEATTHQVNQDYDQGTIIRRTSMSILKPDRKMAIEEITDNLAVQKELLNFACDIQKQLLPIEHDNVVLTLQDYVKGEIPVYRRVQPLIPKQYVKSLDEAKKLAIGLLTTK